MTGYTADFVPLDLPDAIAWAWTNAGPIADVLAGLLEDGLITAGVSQSGLIRLAPTLKGLLTQLGRCS